MNATALARRLPRVLGRQLIHFEYLIEDAVAAFAAQLPVGARVLDAGAGEGQYAHHFARQRYVGVDLAIGDVTWNYRSLDAIADLNALPFAETSFDAALNVVTLEHLREPLLALREIARVLKPGGLLLLAAPHEWEVHQSPHDFFRYTRHGLEHLFKQAGFDVASITPAGGYFRLLSRRFLNGLPFFTGGWRWVLFPFAAVALGSAALIAPLFEGLDREKNFTLGYVCVVSRR